MNNIRILSLIAAVVMMLSCIGCNSEIPEETTDLIVDTTIAPETPPAETEPEETEPPFEIYEGPSADFKFTLESVLGNISYNEYTDDLFITTKSNPEGCYAEWFKEMIYNKISPENIEKLKSG